MLDEMACSEASEGSAGKAIIVVAARSVAGGARGCAWARLRGCVRVKYGACDPPRATERCALAHGCGTKAQPPASQRSADGIIAVKSLCPGLALVQRGPVLYAHASSRAVSLVRKLVAGPFLPQALCARPRAVVLPQDSFARSGRLVAMAHAQRSGRTFFSPDATSIEKGFYWVALVVSILVSIISILAPLITPECDTQPAPGLLRARSDVEYPNVDYPRGMQRYTQHVRPPVRASACAQWCHAPALLRTSQVPSLRTRLFVLLTPATPIQNCTRPTDACKFRRYLALLGMNKWECTMCARVFCSIVLGSIIGWERRRADRPAGIRYFAQPPFTPTPNLTAVFARSPRRERCTRHAVLPISTQGTLKWLPPSTTPQPTELWPWCAWGAASLRSTRRLRSGMDRWAGTRRGSRRRSPPALASSAPRPYGKGP